eukprot:12490861-Alexandrium_andersonii.AAC.1
MSLRPSAIPDMGSGVSGPLPGPLPPPAPLFRPGPCSRPPSGSARAAGAGSARPSSPTSGA